MNFRRRGSFRRIFDERKGKERGCLFLKYSRINIISFASRKVCNIRLEYVEVSQSLGEKRIIR